LLYVTLGGLLLAGALAFMLKLQDADLWVVVIGALVITGGLAFYLAAHFVRPVAVRLRDRSRGIVRLRLRNPAYGSMVAEHIRGL
jgi:hypothetical protein